MKDGWSVLFTFIAVAVGSLVSLMAMIFWHQTLLTLQRTWEFRAIGTTLESAIHRSMAGVTGSYEENGFFVNIEKVSSSTVLIEIKGSKLEKSYVLSLTDGEED